MAIEIRLLQSADAEALRNVADGAFDNTIDMPATREFLDDPRHHLAVAIDNGLVVGFISAVHYAHPDKPRPEMWINEVQVAPTRRRRGLAKRMLDRILEKGRELGCTEAWVLTEVANGPARGLYESRGGIEEPEAGVMYEFRLEADG